MKNLSKRKKIKGVKKSARWEDLIKLSQLKEKEYANEWDTYYTDEYYNLISNYENEYINGGNY